MACLIDARGLRKSFPRREGRPWPLSPRNRVAALDGVDLRLRAGKILAIGGDNGAGKTTLLKVLAALLIPDAGSLAVVGADPAREPARVRRAVGAALHGERSFHWRLSCRANLEFFAALHGLDRVAASRRIEELAELFGLAKDLDEPFHSLSSGIRRRGQLARALLHDPPILLFDEPTQNLAPESAQTILKYISTLCEKKGKAAIIVTHEPDRLLGLPHRRARMEAGRLFQEEEGRGKG